MSEVAITLEELAALAANETTDERELQQYIPLPHEVFETAPGFIGDYYRFLCKCALFELPEAFLSAALAVMATATGRKFRFQLGNLDTRSNLYLFVLAPTGAGKDFARTINERILEESDRVGCDDFTSSAAMLNSLIEQPCQLWQIDEFAKLLGIVNSERASTHVREIPATLLKLYTSSHRPKARMRAYADKQKNCILNQPHVTIYGTSTPVDFWEKLTAGQVQDGLVGRMLIFEDRYAPMKSPKGSYPLDSQGCVIEKNDSIEDLPSDLTYTVNDWLIKGQETDSVIDIRIQKEARERIDEHILQISSRRMTETPIRSAIWSRVSEKTAKLSFLAAMSRGSEIIERRDVEWAILLSSALARRLVARISENIAENMHHSNVNKVLRLIENQAHSRRQLTRSTRSLRAPERDAILADLVESGEVIRVSVVGTRKPTEWFGTSYKQILKGVRSKIDNQDH